MAEKKADEQPKAAVTGTANLAAAGASSDPAVHQLLAERETAISNGDAGAVKALTAQLADLGVK